MKEKRVMDIHIRAENLEDVCNQWLEECEERAEALQETFASFTKARAKLVAYTKRIAKEIRDKPPEVPDPTGPPPEAPVPDIVVVEKSVPPPLGAAHERTVPVSETASVNDSTAVDIEFVERPAAPETAEPPPVHTRVDGSLDCRCVDCKEFAWPACRCGNDSSPMGQLGPVSVFEMTECEAFLPLDHLIASYPVSSVVPTPPAAPASVPPPLPGSEHAEVHSTVPWADYAEIVDKQTIDNDLLAEISSALRLAGYGGNAGILARLKKALAHVPLVPDGKGIAFPRSLMKPKPGSETAAIFDVAESAPTPGGLRFPSLDEYALVASVADFEVRKVCVPRTPTPAEKASLQRTGLLANREPGLVARLLRDPESATSKFFRALQERPADRKTDPVEMHYRKCIDRIISINEHYSKVVDPPEGWKALINASLPVVVSAMENWRLRRAMSKDYRMQVVDVVREQDEVFDDFERPRKQVWTSLWLSMHDAILAGR